MNDNRNQNNGQPNGQGQNAEQSAKYFHSERDKLYAENQKLKKYEKLGKFMESRPDAARAVANTLKKGPGRPRKPMPNRPMVKKPENFDPWEAYNDPKSESYRYRLAEMQQAATQASAKVVNSTVGKQMAQMRQGQAMDKLTSQLKDRGMNDEQIKSFIEFSSKNPAEYGVDGVIKMWQSIGGQQSVQPPSPLDNVRNTQSTPATGGILQGQEFKTKSSEDEMWEGIKSAGGVGNKLP